MNSLMKFSLRRAHVGRRARACRTACALVGALGTALVSPAALAGPGAHGPNGEHLDAPPAIMSSGGAPRLETHSEDFELVARLRAGELSVFIDRYATNEPVLRGTLDVAAGDHKARASFREASGDYLVNDAALVRTLARPGQHPLVFTLTMGDEGDLLEGVLVTPDASEDAAPGPSRAARWGAAVAGAAAALALLLLGVWALRRGRRASAFNREVQS